MTAKTCYRHVALARYLSPKILVQVDTVYDNGDVLIRTQAVYDQIAATIKHNTIADLQYDNGRLSLWVARHVRYSHLSEVD